MSRFGLDAPFLLLLHLFPHLQKLVISSHPPEYKVLEQLYAVWVSGLPVGLRSVRHFISREQGVSSASFFSRYLASSVSRSRSSDRQQPAPTCPRSIIVGRRSLLKTIGRQLPHFLSKMFSLYQVRHLPSMFYSSLTPHFALHHLSALCQCRGHLGCCPIRVVPATPAPYPWSRFSPNPIAAHAPRSIIGLKGRLTDRATPGLAEAACVKALALRGISQVRHSIAVGTDTPDWAQGTRNQS